MLVKNPISLILNTRLSIGSTVEEVKEDEIVHHWQQDVEMSVLDQIPMGILERVEVRGYDRLLSLISDKGFYRSYLVAL